ncbi:MAG: PA domain-containing protein [Planctomycetota bacterium]
MQSLAHSGTPLAAHGRFLLSSLPGALTIAAALALLPAAAAQVPAVSLEPANAPVDDLQAPPAEVRRYMSHVNFLADPFLQGRLPGTQGMEIAKDYVQYWFEAAGLKPGVPGKDGAEDSWRQPFELAGTFQLQEVALEGPGGKVLEREKDYSVPGWGGFGDVTGELCFVGYAIEEGTEDVPYQGFPAECDLTGKVVLMLRFEPMNDEGRSAFTGRSWSARAGLGPKLSAVAQRGAAAVLVVSPPGARDSRAKNLVDVSSDQQPNQAAGDAGARRCRRAVAREEHKARGADRGPRTRRGSCAIRQAGARALHRGLPRRDRREPDRTPGKGALAGEYVGSEGTSTTSKLRRFRFPRPREQRQACTPVPTTTPRVVLR